jgi:hypothetical protein
MRKHNIYVYPLEGKVIFPYHEYRFTISSHSYQRMVDVIQLKITTTSLDSSPNLMSLNSIRKLIPSKDCHASEHC